MKCILIIFLLTITFISFAQPPQGIPYQAIARNSAGNIIVSQPIRVRFTIHDSMATGSIVYRETFTPTTNHLGLFNVNVGMGTIVSGTFNGINWGHNSKFMQVEMDATGGTSYVDMGTTQMMSVPYALYAGSAGNNSVWSINGNSGVNSTTNFIGTTDTCALRFRVNNEWAGEINSVSANTSFGSKAGRLITSGLSNVAIGANSLYTNSIGFQNTAIGTSSLYSNSTGYNNTAIGRLSLNNNLTGSNNSAIGEQSMMSNTIGNTNVGLGSSSLYFNTSGSGNAATGVWSLYSNTIGNWNTSTGIQSLYSNTIGFSNVAIGAYSLHNNTTGSNLVAIGDSALYNQNGGYGWNVAIGSKALYGNTTGYNNTAVGIVALLSNTTGLQNTAIGAGVLRLSTTGDNNTGVGTYSLAFNTIGYSNTANGSQSMSQNTTGYNNTATGVHSLNSNTTGYLNTATGYQSLYSNITGSNNTAVGIFSLSSNTTGGFNTATGEGSLAVNVSGSNNTAIGGGSLGSNTTGQFNTGVGVNSLLSNSTNSNITAIGFGTDVIGSGITNASAIGTLATVNASNKIVVGNSGVTTIGGYSNWSNLSDGRFKTDIKNNVPGLEFILKLVPVTYHFEARKFEQFLGRQDSLLQAQYTSYELAEKQVRTGFVAQDVEKVVHTLNYDFSGLHIPTNEKDNYSLAYGEFTVPLVKAVQEQQEIILKQQKNIEELQRQLLDVLIRLEKLGNSNTK